MTKEIDNIFDDITKDFYDKVHEVNAIILEATDIISEYRLIGNLVSEICSSSNPDDNKILELKENFYRMLKHLNSINNDLYLILFETDFSKKI